MGVGGKRGVGSLGLDWSLAGVIRVPAGSWSEEATVSVGQGVPVPYGSGEWQQGRVSAARQPPSIASTIASSGRSDTTPAASTEPAEPANSTDRNPTPAITPRADHAPYGRYNRAPTPQIGQSVRRTIGNLSSRHRWKPNSVARLRACKDNGVTRLGVRLHCEHDDVVCGG